MTAGARSSASIHQNRRNDGRVGDRASSQPTSTKLPNTPRRHRRLESYFLLRDGLRRSYNSLSDYLQANRPSIVLASHAHRHRDGYVNPIQRNGPEDDSSYQGMTRLSTDDSEG